MYIILGVTSSDNQAHKRTFTNENRALNFMSFLQGNGVGFIMNTSFPSAYPKFEDANKLITKSKVSKSVLSKLSKLEKLQDINATRMLLS